MAIMTNAFDVGGIGANLVPQLTPNIGALANVVGSTMSYGSTVDDPITNEDGTITLPTIELQSNDPNLAPGELQNRYGTDLMPYFNWVEAVQTGTYTYNPEDDDKMQEEIDRINDDFEKKHGINAQQAAMQLEAERASQKLAGAAAAGVGSNFVTSLVGQGVTDGVAGPLGSDYGSAFKESFATVNPLNKFLGGKTPNYTVGDKEIFLTPKEQVKLELNPDNRYSPIEPTGLKKGQDFLAASNQDLTFGQRLNPFAEGGGLTSGAKAAAGGMIADTFVQVAMGADPMDAIKDAAKTTVLSYVANALIPGSGGIVRFLSKFFQREKIMAEEMNRMDRPPMPDMEGANMRQGQDEAPNIDNETVAMAQENIKRPSEKIAAVLVARLGSMTEEQLAMLDRAITPEAAEALIMLLPELRSLIQAIDSDGAMSQQQAQAPQAEAQMGALGGMG